MKKQELVDRLEKFVSDELATMIGQNELALFLLTYLSGLEIPNDEKYDFTSVVPHIPQLVLSAIQDLDQSDWPWARTIKQQYEQETGRPFIDPTSVDSGNNVQAVMMVEALASIVESVTGNEYASMQTRTLLNAEREALQSRFYKFLYQVYKTGGLGEVIASNNSGMSGSFGDTTLRSFATAGRLMLTFARDGSDGHETSVSFVIKEDDPNGLGCGLQSCFGTLTDALSMIDEVCSGWEDHRETFRTNNKVMAG